jgi:GNAT superfamily N-acetyltransferase
VGLRGGREPFPCRDEGLSGLPGATHDERALEGGNHHLGEGATQLLALLPEDARSACVTRLFVRPEFRGQGLARSLVQQLVTLGRSAIYQRIYLESHVSMTTAHWIHAEEGFVVVNPLATYNSHLRRMVICMEWLGP